MTISNKLWIGFGTLTALLVLFSVTILARVWSVEGLVQEQANVARPRSAATRELEINVLDYALGVHEYLQDRSPAIRQRATGDADDVERELAEYQRFAMNDQQRALATRFAALWKEMRALGQALLAAENPAPEAAAMFRAQRIRLGTFLNDEMQPEANTSYDARRDATLQDVRTIVRFVVVLLIVASLIAVGTSVVVGRDIVQTEGALHKGRLDAALLERSIRYALQHKQHEEELEGRVAARTVELARANAALKEADRHKNEFMATLAHELRNPLAAIRNAAQVLGLASGNRDAVRAASQMLERQSGQMVRLVDDMLDMSRICQGKIALRKERIELVSAVNHAVEASRLPCENLGHVIAVDLPPQPIELHGDLARLTQVVGNLLNNACKFTNRGGRIELTVERERSDALIRVRDNGIGIAANELPRIFDMFMQAETSLERSTSGLGLGLTLVKNLVEMHGGTVTAHSAGSGQGSEFVVRLPIP